MRHSRRDFIKSAALLTTATVFPTVIPSSLFGSTAPSEKITLGFIGMGNQGVHANLKTFLAQKDAQVIAVCDAFRSRAANAQNIVNKTYGNSDCIAVQDFRNIISNPSIDAVVISTPDHWHVPMSLMALEAGKDVFCEKPTLNIEEGRTLVEGFEKIGAIFQAGIEDRSVIYFHKIVEWVKNGAIGNLERVKVIMPQGRDYPLEEPIKPPDDLDWNLWQGPAEYHEYTRNRTGDMQWRQIEMYSKGTILDIGTHLVDTAQIGINDPAVCPEEVSGSGEIPEGRMTDVPTKYDLTYLYSNGVEMNVKSGKGLVWDPDSCFLEFQGDKGWIRRKTWEAPLEASNKKILRTRYTEAENKHWPLPRYEQRDFLDCVKSRKRATYTSLDLHQMSTTLHMGVTCIKLGRKLYWDTQNEKFKNDNVANRLSKSPEPRNWEKE